MGANRLYSFGKLIFQEHHLGFGYVSTILDIAAGEPEIEGHRPGTGPDYAKVDLQPGDGIAHQMYDFVAFPYAKVYESIGYPVGILLKLAPGDFLPQPLAGDKFYQGYVVGVYLSVSGEHLRYVHSWILSSEVNIKASPFWEDARIILLTFT